jgi:AAA+ ATPase superfamily predicted ATPase
MTKPLRTLIIRHILSEYYNIQDSVGKLTRNSAPFHKVLTGIALGDRRTNSAFKRADIDYDEGIEAIYKLEELEVITTETALDHLTTNFEENDVSDKLLFTTPFLRFWFAFVSPLYRGIKRDEYDECFDRFNNYQAEFMGLVFEQLCHEYVKKVFNEDSIEEIGRYWDEDKNELDLIAQTESGKVIVGSCKYTNNKVKKSEINRLKEICEKLEIVPDFVILFSKKGFTNELKSEKGESLKLYTVKSLKTLLN